MNLSRMEEVFDTLLFVCAVTIMLIFFGVYWRENFQSRYVEVLVDEFVENAVNRGEFTKEDYEGLLTDIWRVDAGYRVEITHTGTEQIPIYSKHAANRLEDYYTKRNCRKETELADYILKTEDRMGEDIRLQSESNASILAAGEYQYLPLPKEGDELTIGAVREYQEVYEGEELITLCLVTSEEGSYYVEAEPMKAKTSGRIPLKVVLQEGEINVWVDVVCFPRNLVCEYGHVFQNTKQRIEEAKREEGRVICPFCVMLPKTLECNKPVVYLTTGDSLNEAGVSLKVQYLAGNEETVNSQTEGWQDTYDKNYCGMQQVEILFRGKKTEVTVISEGGICRNCRNRCSVRNYRDYKDFPYCTECMSKVYLFSGQTGFEEFCVETGEIVRCLEQDGRYGMLREEHLMVIVKKGKEWVTMVEKMIRKQPAPKEDMS